MCLIEPAKTRHICTKYTRSENGNFLVQYLPQTSSVNFTCILNILSIYQINFSSTAVFNEKVKVQKISQILCADMPCFHRPGHNIHPWKSVYLYVFMYRTIKKIGSKKTFDKLQQFAKFIINFTNSTTFPMQTDFNLPKIFYQTPYNPYSLNLLLPEIFTIR